MPVLDAEPRREEHVLLEARDQHPEACGELHVRRRRGARAASPAAAAGQRAAKDAHLAAQSSEHSAGAPAAPQPGPSAAPQHAAASAGARAASSAAHSPGAGAAAASETVPEESHAPSQNSFQGAAPIGRPSAGAKKITLSPIFHSGQPQFEPLGSQCRAPPGPSHCGAPFRGSGCSL